MQTTTERLRGSVFSDQLGYVSCFRRSGYTVISIETELGTKSTKKAFIIGFAIHFEGHKKEPRNMCAPTPRKLVPHLPPADCLVAR